MSVDILLPMLPPRILWPNARPAHWAQRHRAAQEFRDQAILATRAAMAADPDGFAALADVPLLVLDATIAWPAGQRQLDDDNAWASLKSARDGIALALERNDRSFRQGRLTQTRGSATILFTLRPHGGDQLAFGQDHSVGPARWPMGVGR